MNKKSIELKIYMKNGKLHCKEMFDKLIEIKEEYEKNGIELERNHKIKKMINRFSGGYISPSMIKAHNNCPASTILNNLVPESKSIYLTVGTMFHSIFEDFYNLNGEERTWENMQRIKQEYIEKENLQENVKGYSMIENYINGYRGIKDYLNEEKFLDHKNLSCEHEVFIKGNFKPLGVELPKPMYCSIDRVDIRDSGIYLFDYKTGTYFSPSCFTLDGYLPQMISYKWASEFEYGEKIQSAYLITPGTNIKYREMDVYSLVNQSIFIERILEYCKEIDKVTESREYEIKDINSVNKILENKNFRVEDNVVEQIIYVNFEYDDVEKNPESEETETQEESK